MSPDTPLEWIGEPSIESLVTFPGEWWNSPMKSEHEQKNEVMENAMGGVSRIVISDRDADGLGCIAMFETAFDDETLGSIVHSHNDDLSLTQVINSVKEAVRISEYPFTPELYICDLSPNDAKAVHDALEDYNGQVHIFDHHQWGEEDIETIGEVSNTLDVREEEEVCTADVVYEYLEDMFADEEEKERMKTLAEITRDHDIWIKEDDRSDDLVDYQFISENEEYVEAVKETGGILMDKDEIQEELENHREIKRKKIEYQAKNADWAKIIRTHDGPVLVFGTPDFLPDEPNEEIPAEEELIVALSYGTAYSSELGSVLCEGWSSKDGVETEDDYIEELPEENYSSGEYRPGDADLAVVIPPWDKLHFRSSESFPYCNRVAEELGGGGHKEAAGAKPGWVGMRDNCEFDTGVHWYTAGEGVKENTVETIRDLFNNEEVGIVEEDEEVEPIES